MVATIGWVLLALAAAPVAPEHKASDMALIANWACGDDPTKAFGEPFGNKRQLIGREDALLYCDLPGVETPARMKAVTYEFIQARRQRIRDGHKASPAVVIVRSSRGQPTENGEPRFALELPQVGERVYYVEIADGTMGMTCLKLSVREVGGKTVVETLFGTVN